MKVTSQTRIALPGLLLAVSAMFALLCGCGATRLSLPNSNGLVAKRLYPSNDRPWRPEMSRLAWVESDGDQLTIRNVRNNQYVTEDEFVPQYDDRTSARR